MTLCRMARVNNSRHYHLQRTNDNNNSITLFLFAFELGTAVVAFFSSPSSSSSYSSYSSTDFPIEASNAQNSIEFRDSQRTNKSTGNFMCADFDA